MDIAINSLMAIYVENDLTMLVNGRPLKAISHYWRKKIAEYQSTLNKYGLETSKRLRRMYMKWRRQIKHYIDAKVRQAIEWLYGVGVSTVKVGYPKKSSQNYLSFSFRFFVFLYGVLEELKDTCSPSNNSINNHTPKIRNFEMSSKYITQENGNFDNVHVWTYGYLLRGISEVAEEYGIDVIYVDEAYTSSRCPLHGEGCGVRISRGLFKCTKLNKVFNADLAAAYNILLTPITPSPERGRGNGRRPGQGLNPQGRGDVAQTSPP
jgi:putative transposase